MPAWFTQHGVVFLRSGADGVTAADAGDVAEWAFSHGSLSLNSFIDLSSPSGI